MVIGFFVFMVVVGIVVGVGGIGIDGKVLLMWFCVIYLFFMMGEFCFSLVGFSMIIKFVF